jgi:hypothetical protein
MLASSGVVLFPRKPQTDGAGVGRAPQAIGSGSRFEWGGDGAVPPTLLP